MIRRIPHKIDILAGEILGELRAEKNQRNAADERKPGQVIGVKAAQDFAGEHRRHDESNSQQERGFLKTFIRRVIVHPLSDSRDATFVQRLSEDDVGAFIPAGPLHTEHRWQTHCDCDDEQPKHPRFRTHPCGRLIQLEAR